MATAILDYPSGICQTRVAVTMQTATGRTVSPFSLKQARQFFGGMRWRGNIQFLPGSRDDLKKLEAFLIKVVSEGAKVRIGPDAYCSLSDAAASGSPQVNVATAGQFSLTTLGWTGDVLQLNEGDYFQIGDHLYRTTAPVNAAGGSATIECTPHLRESYAAGTTITVANARGVFWLDQNEVTVERAPNGNGGRFTVPPMEIVEAV